MPQNDTSPVTDSVQLDLATSQWQRPLEAGMNLCEGKDSFERIISLLESLSAVPTPKALIYDDWFFRVLYRQEERFFFRKD